MSEEKTIEYDCECGSCAGTGLYAGMGERDGAWVVCSSCKGTGHRHVITKYKTFTRRHRRNGIQRVYRTNPGICIGTGNRHSLNDFGGMPYSEWLADPTFPKGSEDRAHTCPAWWYQSADYKLKPDWDDENQKCGFGTFSHCRHFNKKQLCWARFDAEQEGSKP